MEIVHPDKVRFRADDLIHAVELSDERSVRNFITFWFRSTPEAMQFADRYGLSNKHEPTIYHREGDDNRAGYGDQGVHYHLDLSHPPRLSDLDRFELPDSIRCEIRDHYAERSRQDPVH